MQKFVEADYYELDWYYEECTDGKPDGDGSPSSCYLTVLLTGLYVGRGEGEGQGGGLEGMILLVGWLNTIDCINLPVSLFAPVCIASVT